MSKAAYSSAEIMGLVMYVASLATLHGHGPLPEVSIHLFLPGVVLYFFGRLGRTLR